MITIHKYRLLLRDAQVIPMPETIKLLSVGDQDGCLMLWVMVRPGPCCHHRLIHLAGTGPVHQIEGRIAHTRPDGVQVAPFIGTAVMSNGFVWHVFDGGEVPAGFNPDS